MTKLIDEIEDVLEMAEVEDLERTKRFFRQHRIASRGRPCLVM